MAPHSNTLAWKIPWTKEPGGLQFMGSPRVRHDWVTSLSLSLSYIGEGDGNPLQCSRLENPRDGGAWWAAVYGVAQSRIWLKWLSSSSSNDASTTPHKDGVQSVSGLVMVTLWRRWENGSAGECMAAPCPLAHPALSISSIW